ncbi:MAG: tail fiber protein [Clostridium sp.]|jgi:hypothetical protein|nr:tail fiber protein [Clostridium sp.]
MAEPTFARIGYKNASSQFEPLNIRAQDVFTTESVSVETHITDAAKHLTNEQATAITNAIQASQKGAANGVAPLGADSKIPAQYVSIDLFSTSQVVATYNALLALSASAAPLKTTALVQDASGDSTVASGWALYIRTATAGAATDWLKLTEGEGLDIDFSNYIQTSQKDTANGVATLDGDGKVPGEQLPAGSTSAPGAVQLSDAVNANDSAKAATQTAAKTAYDAAMLLDAAYCADETDMASKNLRVGAFVLMAVENTQVDEVT